MGTILDKAILALNKAVGTAEKTHEQLSGVSVATAKFKDKHKKTVAGHQKKHTKLIKPSNVDATKAEPAKATLVFDSAQNFITPVKGYRK